MIQKYLYWLENLQKLSMKYNYIFNLVHPESLIGGSTKIPNPTFDFKDNRSIFGV